MSVGGTRKSQLKPEQVRSTSGDHETHPIGHKGLDYNPFKISAAVLNIMFLHADSDFCQKKHFKKLKLWLLYNVPK